MTLLSIAYVSTATRELSDDDIAGILTTARLNNGRNGLTGALLFHGGRFVQILEGPPDVVSQRFEIISADPRHRIVEKVREVVILERQFPQWTMGFRSVDDDPNTRLDGFEDFFGRRGKARLEHADNEAQQFLEWVGEYWLPRR